MNEYYKTLCIIRIAMNEKIIAHSRKIFKNQVLHELNQWDYHLAEAV